MIIKKIYVFGWQIHKFRRQAIRKLFGYAKTATSQSRINGSEVRWLFGFFAPSFQIERNTSLADASSFNLVIILKGGTANNTLAFYNNHSKREDKAVGHLGDADMFSCLSK